MSARDNKGFKFFIQGVRCFKEEAELHIRPLTLLVGENSTGKSTVLGCLNVLQGAILPSPFSSPPDFNRDPYHMGSFDNIARRVQKGPRSFRFGGLFALRSKHATIKITATFHKESHGSEPVVTSRKYELSYQGETTSFHTSGRNPDDLRMMWFGDQPDMDEIPNEVIDLLRDIYSKGRARLGMVRESVSVKTKDRVRSQYGVDEERHKKMLIWQELETDIRRYLPPYFESTGPIRAEPQRTYDPIRSQFNPQGMEVPVILRNLKRKNLKEWLRIKKDMEQFGKDAGMFERIEVKELGVSDIDPFQIHIKVPGMPQANLVDVGYGVSQVLPLLARVLEQRASRPSRWARPMSERGSVHLIQQSEIHLHPQGQAALVSFLVNQMNSSEKPRFIIETHSDYIIDRARIEVRRGNIAPEDVSIIYLESKRGGVKAHNLTLDKQSNLQNVPNSYRRFFLEETNRMLGFKEYL